MRPPPLFVAPDIKPPPVVAPWNATIGRGFLLSTLVMAICGLLAVSTAFGQSDSGRGGGRGRGNRGTSGQDPAERSARFETLLRGMDANGNGMIDADEVGSGPRKAFVERMFSRVGVEPKYPLAISQVVQAATDFEASRSGGRRSGSRGSQSPPTSATPTDPARVRPEFQFGAPATTVVVTGPSAASTDAIKSVAPASSGTGASAGSAEGSSTSSDASKPVAKKPIRARTPKERLPKNLPDWFLQKADADGQVPMAAFTDDWTPEATARFERLDLNRDGIITAAECLKAEKRSGGGAK